MQLELKVGFLAVKFLHSVMMGHYFEYVDGKS